MNLTDATIRALKPPQTGQKVYYDDALAGFGCRVSQGGTKTFVLVRGRDRRRMTIGRYGIITLAKAREEAKRLLAEFTLGRVRPQSITYTDASKLFLDEKTRTRRKSTVDSYRRLLKRLGYKGQLSDLTHAEAARRLDKITAPSERGHVLVTCKVFTRWCAKRRYIEHDPFLGLSKPKTKKRRRTLSDDEIRAIWRATEERTTFNRIVRFCFSTAQRRGEVSLLLPAYIRGDICTIPEDIAKNHNEHPFPLLPLAQAQLIPTNGFLFGTGDRPFTDWGHYKAELDKASGVTGWTLHDIRRTVRSRFGGLGIAPHIGERILNHISYRSEVEQTYDTYSYIPEMKAALQLWESRLQSLVG